MLFNRKDKGASPRERALWGDLMGMGMVFPIAIAAGFFLGRWAGGKLGHPKLGMGLGLAWGVATGFWELYKTTKRLDAYDEAERREQDQDKDRDGHGSGR